MHETSAERVVEVEERYMGWRLIAGLVGVAVVDLTLWALLKAGLEAITRLILA